MIMTFTAPSSKLISLDLREQFGKSVELECFQFVTAPVAFRLMRGDQPLQDWQTGNGELYDLQHPPTVREWSRDGHRFLNDLQHRDDVMTSGVLSHDLAMETQGLGFDFVLLVWLREGTWRKLPASTQINFTSQI
jgi:hypothetical protein